MRILVNFSAVPLKSYLIASEVSVLHQVRTGYHVTVAFIQGFFLLEVLRRKITPVSF
jgi:hypothetical protein